ncbi:MAG: hypothetical protein CMJ76_14920 [Planctomycetaceae bacterium]|nr:hypothetical protein [Planctomycetaceae bacterium]
MTTPPNQIYFLSATIGIAVIAVISQSYLDLPLWIDELHTSWTILADFDLLTERANAGNQSPLYFFLLKLVVSLTGQSEISLRIFSVSCACGSVITLNWLCHRHQLNLFATLLTIISFAAGHIQLLFAVEARSYSLLTLLVLILFCVSSTRWDRTYKVEYEQKRKIHWPLETMWIVFAVLCIYTHYMAIPAIGSLLLADLLVSPAPISTRLRTLGLQGFFLGVVIGSQFDALENIYQHRSQWATFIPANDATLKALIKKLPVISTLIMPGVCLITFRPQLGARKPLIFGALMLALIPYLTAWTTTRMDWVNWFFPRYLVSCLPGFSLFFGFSMASITQDIRPVFRPLGIGLCCLMVFILFDSKVIENYQTEQITVKNERWDVVAATLCEKAKPEDSILLAGGLVEDIRLAEIADAQHTPSISMSEYCTFPLNGMYPLTEGLQIEPISEYRNPDLLENRIRKASQGWLVVRGQSHNRRVQKVLVKMFGPDGFADHRIPGKVNLYFFQMVQ